MTRSPGFTRPEPPAEGLPGSNEDENLAARAEPFDYYTDGEGYIIVSRGPDSVFQINPARDYKYAENSGAIAPGLVKKQYDPSNGSLSMGDIFRVSRNVYWNEDENSAEDAKTEKAKGNEKVGAAAAAQE